MMSLCHNNGKNATVTEQYWYNWGKTDEWQVDVQRVHWRVLFIFDWIDSTNKYCFYTQSLI